MVEVFGVISIVAALLLLASQIQQSNRIAKSELMMQLASGYNDIHFARASNSDFAKLFAKLEAPETHLITATEASQIRGLAWQYLSLSMAAQNAYDNDLLSRKELDELAGRVTLVMESLPGIREHFADIYELLPAFQGKEVFAPITEYIAAIESDLTE